MLRVLTYHRIADADSSPDLNPRLISATPSGFAHQMRDLAASYTVVSLPEVLSAVRGETRLPERAVLITFDDAYVDFGRVAWPILRHFRLPATLFVPTAYPDQPQHAFWWDRLHRALGHGSRQALVSTPWGPLPLRSSEDRHAALRRITRHVKSIPHAEGLALVDSICAELGDAGAPEPSVLGWDELRQLSRAGVTVCAHTRTHALLTQLSPLRARAEIVGSQQDVRRHVGRALPVFCYPDGRYDDTHVALLRREGFQLAFTTTPGHNELRAHDPDRLQLHRTNITPRTSALLMRCRLTRLGAGVDRWRHDWRRRTERLRALTAESLPAPCDSETGGQS
jgi:peptidoglycan/xylan/chitin deacetylase (PgdA/CDA1 family)